MLHKNPYEVPPPPITQLVCLLAECPNKSDVLIISVPSGTIKSESSIIKELVRMVRELIGPIAAFRVAAAVTGLPRTRSGKTARKSIADLARNRSVKVTIRFF